MKFVLVVLFLVAVAIGLVGLERYSAGVGLESFMTRTRQITNAMPEDAVIKTMGGQPNERIDLSLQKEGHDTCRKAGAATVMVYLRDHVGWFRNFGLTTGWDEFVVCLDGDRRVIRTNSNFIHVRAPQSRDPGTRALRSSTVGVSWTLGR